MITNKHMLVLVAVMLFSCFLGGNAFGEGELRKGLVNEAILDNLPLNTTFTLSDQTYNFNETNTYNTWGGELEISDDKKTAFTSVWDSDGDVFFALINGGRYCVVDSGFNYITGERFLNVYIMFGASCSFSSNDANVVINVQDANVNCRWNGTFCAPVTEVLSSSFSLEVVDNSAFTFEMINLFPWVNVGGEINLNGLTAQTRLDSSNSNLYLNATTPNGENWCLISSESTIENEPISVVYLSHNAICEVEQESQNSFKVVVRAKDGVFCKWDGNACAF